MYNASRIKLHAHNILSEKTNRFVITQTYKSLWMYINRIFNIGLTINNLFRFQFLLITTYI